MIISDITSEIKRLSDLSRKMQKVLNRAPDGTLHEQNNGKTIYYRIRKKTARNKYQDVHIKKSDLYTLHRYSNKALCKAALKAINAQLKEMQSWDLKLLKQSGDHYRNISQKYAEHADPELLHFAQQSRCWAAEPFESNPFPISKEYCFQGPENTTFRSKLEGLAAYALVNTRIAYRYEALLILRNGQSRYPDFTIMSPFTGNLLIVEVFGMMSDPDYAADAMKKIREYEDSGWIMGINFLPVFEYPGVPFQAEYFTSALMHMLQHC